MLTTAQKVAGARFSFSGFVSNAVTKRLLSDFAFPTLKYPQARAGIIVGCFSLFGITSSYNLAAKIKEAFAFAKSPALIYIEISASLIQNFETGLFDKSDKSTAIISPLPRANIISAVFISPRKRGWSDPTSRGFAPISQVVRLISPASYSSPRRAFTVFIATDASAL